MKLYIFIAVILLCLRGTEIKVMVVMTIIMMIGNNHKTDCNIGINCNNNGDDDSYC